jgi:hypothetical protein
MIWVIWRQHRTEVAILGAIVGVLGMILLALGAQMHDLFPGDPARCVPNNPGEACADAFDRLTEEYGYVESAMTLFYLVPVVVGAFLGAPLLAREFENGTWQLAWTQAVPRMRWLAAKLAALAGVTVALSAVFTAVLTWVRQPMDAFDGRFEYNAYDVEGLAPVAYALFAFGVATAAGAFLRRALPAFGVAFGAFLAARMAVALFARPAFDTPLIAMRKVPAKGPTDQGGYEPVTSFTNWTIDRGYADAAGRRLSWSEFYELEHAAEQAGTNRSQFLHERGIQEFEVYHPADRFWTFQFIEAALFVGVAAVLIGAVVWRVRRRAY